METAVTNQPVQTLRDGNLKATIWQNEGAKGNYYSVQLRRTYRDDDGNYHDTASFSHGDMLKLAHLTACAYDTISQYRQGRTA